MTKRRPTRITPEDGEAIQALGVPHFKKRNPVWLMRLDEEVVVETNEGNLRGAPGHFVAYDPISGHVWPVDAEYVAQHYERPDDWEEAPEGYEPVERFRGWLHEVKPIVGQGKTHVTFALLSIDLTDVQGLLAAVGQMLDVSVAKKVWAEPPELDDDTRNARDGEG